MRSGMPGKDGWLDGWDEGWERWKDEESEDRGGSRKRKGNEGPLQVDLHGLTRKEALALLERMFLGHPKPKGRVILIHGVGRHSADGRQVLKPLVREWLKEHAALFRLVRPGRPGEGGPGVTVVEMR